MNDYSECNQLRQKLNLHYFQYFWRFLAIGSITTLADISLLYVLTEWIGIWYLTSACISYCTGGLISYILNKNLNYKNQSTDYLNQGMVFLGISACSLLLNLGIVFAGVTFMGVSYLIAKICATGIGFFFNYSGQTLITFRLWK